MQQSLPALAQSLSAYAKRPLMQQKLRHRGSMVALHIEGINQSTIALFTQTHPQTVHRWVCRVQEGNLLHDLPRCGRPRSFSQTARLKTIAVYCQQAPPLPGVHQWSLRDAEQYFKEHSEILGQTISRPTIQRILLEHLLRPHRRKYYLQITDPDFFPKMEQITALYMAPPQNLYCFDECTCIQALKPLAPNLPAHEGQPVLEDFDYKRNGISDLIAFLDPATGTVYGQCVPNHNRHTLSRVFTAHVQTLPPDAVIHYIADNLSSHYHEDFCKTVADLSGVAYPTLENGKERRQWLASEEKRLVIHFIPFHASWLNMVEIWFGILKRKCLRPAHFSSVPQLRESILAFIETWNEHFAHPFSWSYTGDGLHAKAVRRFSRLLAIETEQMDCRFLKNQLLLMSNIAEQYIQMIPSTDWSQLLHLAEQKANYMTNIIEADTGPRRQKTAREAYTRFVQTVVNRPKARAKTA